MSATDLQHCDWCSAGSLMMLKCGKCGWSTTAQAAWSMPKRNMDDVMGLSVGSFAEDEACSWIKSTVRQWRDDDAGALECYLGCLPLAIGLASTKEKTRSEWRSKWGVFRWANGRRGAQWLRKEKPRSRLRGSNH